MCEVRACSEQVLKNLYYVLKFFLVFLLVTHIKIFRFFFGRSFDCCATNMEKLDGANEYNPNLITIRYLSFDSLLFFTSPALPLNLMLSSLAPFAAPSFPKSISFFLVERLVHVGCMLSIIFTDRLFQIHSSFKRIKFHCILHCASLCCLINQYI